MIRFVGEREKYPPSLNKKGSFLQIRLDSNESNKKIPTSCFVS